MEKLLTSPPKNWHKPLVLPAVPKNGNVFEDHLELQADAPVSYWGQVYKINGVIRVSVHACRSERRIVLDLSLSGDVSAPCARCLEEARCAVAEDAKYIFSLKSEEQEVKCELTGDGDEDIISLDSWEDEIDLGDFIWELLITSLPSAPLCKEDCRGLCPQCGANLNKEQCSCKNKQTDPRFEILKNFM